MSITIFWQHLNCSATASRNLSQARTARLGGRSFEVGKEFGYLPKGMKLACRGQGYNDNIKAANLRNCVMSCSVSGHQLKNWSGWKRITIRRSGAWTLMKWNSFDLLLSSAPLQSSCQWKTEYGTGSVKFTSITALKKCLNAGKNDAIAAGRSEEADRRLSEGGNHKSIRALHEKCCRTGS